MKNQRDFCWNDRCKRRHPPHPRPPRPPRPPFRPPMPPPPPPRPPRPTPYWDDRDMWMQEEEIPYSFEYEYMVEYYPSEVRWLNAYIQEVIDSIDEPTSFIYDEYPDKFMLYQLCRQIRAQVESEMKAQGVPDGFLDELIQVLLCQEICRRRCRRHRYYLSREDIHFYK